MASPQSTTSQDVASGSAKKLEQITFRFCSECSNMLYPKEDEDAHKLQYTCRTCQYTEDAQTTCVFRNVLNTSAGETAGVTQDVGSDPTVSAFSTPVLCLFCGCTVRCVTCGDNFCRAVDDHSRGDEDGDSDGPVLDHLDLATLLASSCDPAYMETDEFYDEDLMSDYPFESDDSAEQPTSPESSWETFADSALCVDI